jgi:hypothetical protein
MLCGFVAYPLLARTLGRMAGGSVASLKSYIHKHYHFFLLIINYLNWMAREIPKWKNILTNIRENFPIFSKRPDYDLSIPGMIFVVYYNLWHLIIGQTQNETKLKFIISQSLLLLLLFYYYHKSDSVKVIKIQGLMKQITKNIFRWWFKCAYPNFNTWN